MDQARSNSICVRNAEFGVLYTICDVPPPGFPGWRHRVGECVVCLKPSVEHSWPKFLTKNGVEEFVTFYDILQKVET